MATGSNCAARRIVCLLLLFGAACALLGVIPPAGAGASAPQALVPAAVPNDDFDDALVMTTIPFSNTQDIITATTAADDPVIPCTGAKKYNTVWYRYIPAASETLVFSTNSGRALAVWTGTRGSLVNQGCSTGAQLKVSLNAGTTYHIEIARTADYIYPPPTSIGVVFSVWQAGTYPEAFAKIEPANGAAYQSTRPILSWDASKYAASQEYCYDTTNNDACDTSWRAGGRSIELSGLSLGTTCYWQVRATNEAGTTEADGGAWWSFTTAGAADLNPWTGTVSGTSRTMSFDALTDGSLWLNFKVAIAYTGCSGGTKTTTLVTGGPGPIAGGSFSYQNPSNSFRFNGTFSSPTTASGSYNLSNHAVCDWINPPGYCCWALTSGSGTWTAAGPPLTPMRYLHLPLVQKE